jgi:RimJ/RimL family protein N-acetyltransferase
MATVRPGLAFVVRPAVSQDAETIASLLASPADLRQVSPHESFPVDASTVRHWLRERGAGHVLEDHGEIVGYAELVPDQESEGRYWIGHMMIRPDRRGLGLGRRLVLALLRVGIIDREAREIAISAFEDNPAALACYRSCGFRNIGRARVGDRQLREMRLRVRGRRRVLPRAALVPGVWAAVAFSVMLLPIGARTALVSADSPLRFGALLAMGVFLSSLAAALHPVLPEWRVRRPIRWLRTAAFPLLMAICTAVPAGLLLRFVDAGGHPTWRQAFVSSTQESLAIGAVWSLVLLVSTELEPVWRRRPKGPPLEEN